MNSVERLGAPPAWAASMADIRGKLPFDNTQTIMVVAINNRLGVAFADSGAYKMVMNLRMAEAYGFTVQRAVNGDCGRYSVLGSRVEHD